MTTRTPTLALMLAALVAVNPEANAGRGGGRGGGFRGGGGMNRGGGFGGGGMNRGGGFGGGGMNRGGGGFGGGGMNRGGGGFGGGGMNRGGGGFGGGGGGGGFRGSPSMSMPRSPQMDGGGNRGGGFGSGGLGGGNRPGISNRPGGGDNPFNRPGAGGGGERREFPNRPGGGDNPFNRPGAGGGGERPNLPNRPGGGDNPFNRPGGGNNINNRPNIGDRGNLDGNRIGNNNININRNNFNNFNNGFGRWGGGNAWAYGRGYANGYNHGWVNGRWSGHYWPGGWGGGWGNWWGGLGTGLALGGLAGWGLGTAWYGWGYGSYMNPYYTPTVVVQQPVVVGQPDPTPVYSYSQPIDTGAPPPDPAVVETAGSTLDQARSAFSTGNYDQALQLTDQALKSTPNDTAVHEFRALCLFALGRYDEAAAVLYAVLSVGPGWDWTTLISLYPSVNTYTQQLRALEAYRDQHPDSAAARFVLAYHYLTQGHNEDAVAQLKKVAELQPNDQLAAQLVKVLSGDAAPAPEAAPAAPAEPAPAGDPGQLPGQWVATPAKTTNIDLVVGPDDTFTWNVNQNGQVHPIKGKLTFEDGTLTLLPSDNSQPLVGLVTWQDPTHFTFKLAGGPPGDPGLSFARKAGG